MISLLNLETLLISLFRMIIMLLLLTPFSYLAAVDTIHELLFEPIDGKRDREVPVKIYIGQSGTPQPVVLFPHGLGESHENNAYLGKYWAAAGYVTVFMQHPGSDVEVWKSVQIGKRMSAIKSAAGAETALSEADI